MGTSDHGGPRRFFLARTPREGSAELAPEDAEHALRVLRLGPGDALIGLDGRGSAWPLRIAADGERDDARGARGPRRARSATPVRLEADGEPWCEAAPGEPGAPLPRIELAFALPRGPRAADLVDRATQLGAARLSPLECERSNEAARGAGPARLEKLGVVAREACKQCGRLWLPELREPATLDALLAASDADATLLLDPRADTGLLQCIADRRGAARSWSVLVGPEGGFTDAERERALAAGATPVRIAPHVLRIETAAEAALAGLVLALG